MQSRIFSLFIAAVVVSTLTVAAAPSAHAVIVMCGSYEATIVGTPGPDTLTGGSGRDVIAGLGGDDTIDGMSGNDIVCGGPGDDAITVYGGLIHGNGGDDTITATRRDFLYGDAGDDAITCNGSCWEYGGAGNDHLTGGDSRRGNRVDGGPGNDVMIGGAKDDDFVSTSGHDHIDGKAGRNGLDCSQATAGVHVDLAAGVATSTNGWHATIKHIANAGGSKYRDVLLGDKHANQLGDAGGADVLNGRGGDDSFSVHFPSPAKVIGGPGEDIFGAQDTYTSQHFSENVVADLSRGVAYYAARPHTKTQLRGIEDLQGAAGDDVLIGDSKPNVFTGDLRADRLVGGGGNDRLLGDGVGGRKFSHGDKANGGPGTDYCRAAATKHCEKPQVQSALASAWVSHSR